MGRLLMRVPGKGSWVRAVLAPGSMEGRLRLDARGAVPFGAGAAPGLRDAVGLLMPEAAVGARTTGALRPTSVLRTRVGGARIVVERMPPTPSALRDGAGSDGAVGATSG